MKIIIYGRPGCGYCERAKELCEQKSVAYDYRVVGVDITKEALIEKIGKPVSSIPQVFVMSEGFAEYVEGGFEGLRKKLG